MSKENSLSEGAHLMERLAAVLPESLGLMLYAPECADLLYRAKGGDPCECDLYLFDDEPSGTAIVLLLDHLESLGWIWSLDNLGYDPADLSKKLYRLNCGPGEWNENVVLAEGATRIEAVVRAFIAVMEAQSPTEADQQMQFSKENESAEAAG